MFYPSPVIDEKIKAHRSYGIPNLVQDFQPSAQVVSFLLCSVENLSRNFLILSLGFWDCRLNLRFFYAYRYFLLSLICV